MEVVVRETYEEMSQAASALVASVLNAKPDAVLGLATGSSPLGLYKEMARMHREDGLDFSHARTFNLDEYVGLPPSHPQSYRTFMNENLFNHINILPENTYVPSGTTSNYRAFCQWYEAQITACGGVDLQVLGIGSDGHIGFNEPTSSLNSRTRLKTLAEPTIDDNARFFKKREDVPIYAITMGVGTILDAKQILLVANGANKADAVAGMIEGAVTSMNTAAPCNCIHVSKSSWTDPRQANSRCSTTTSGSRTRNPKLRIDRNQEQGKRNQAPHLAAGLARRVFLSEVTRCD